MGSGARAQRMALGASIAEKQGYLATLQAEKQDTSKIATAQQGKIQTLVDQVTATKQPQHIQQPAGPEKKAIGPALLVVIGIIILSFWK